MHFYDSVPKSVKTVPRAPRGGDAELLFTISADGRGGESRLRRPAPLLGRGAPSHGRYRLGRRRLRVVLLAHRGLRRDERTLGRRLLSPADVFQKVDVARVPERERRPASSGPRVLLLAIDEAAAAVGVREGIATFRLASTSALPSSDMAQRAAMVAPRAAACHFKSGR